MRDALEQIFAATVILFAWTAMAWGAGLLFSNICYWVRRNFMPKTYGPETVPEVPKIEFDLRAVHEDPETGRKEIRTHHFIARPDPSAGDFHRFALASASGGGGEMLLVLGKILPRMIANDDGVPAQWEYVELPPMPREQIAQWPGQDVAVVGTLDEPSEPEPNFRGPDGQIYPASQRAKFEDFEAGSSRRRLYHLMFVDENVKVEMKTVAEIMQDLFAAAGKGPGSV